MTLTELLAMPKGISFENYEKLLAEKSKLEKKIQKESNIILDEDDSLNILADEVGSERYNKHLENKQRAEVKRNKAMIRLEQIVQILNGGISYETERKGH